MLLLVRVFSLVTLLATAAVVLACGSKSALFCESDTDCTDPARPFCDTSGDYAASDGVANTCIGNPVDAGTLDADGPDAIPRDVTITITRTGNGSGSIISTPEGILCGNTCTATFPAGSSVHLTADPSGTASFLEWSGACEGAARTCEFIVTNDMNVFARFEPRGQVQWARVFALEGIQTASGVAVDASGNVIMAGEFENTLPLATGRTLESVGATDVYVAKLSAGDHDVIWARRFGGEGHERVRAISTDTSGDVSVVFGEIDSLGPSSPLQDHHLVRLSGATGDEQWRRAYPFLINDSLGMVVGDSTGLPDGRTVVAGYLYQPYDFGAGTVAPADAPDGFVHWVNPDGSLDGVQLVDSTAPGPEGVARVTSGNDGSIAVYGLLSSSMIGDQHLPAGTKQAIAGFDSGRTARWAWPISAPENAQVLALGRHDDLYFAGDLDDEACGPVRSRLHLPVHRDQRRARLDEAT